MSDDDEERQPISPSLAGAAVYAGAPAVISPLLNLPYLASRLVDSGVPIEADAGTPIERLAEFTKAEVKAIKNFAASRGVTMPIVAAPASEAASGGYFIAQTPLERLLARITGTTATEPHIALTTTSLPGAFHEIGHATPIAGSEKLRDAFGLMARVLGQGSGIGNALRLGLASSVLAPPSDDASDTRKFMYNHAPELVGATMVPQIIEEGRATANAIRGSRELGTGVAKTVAELGPALGSYLAGAAAPVIATILAKHVVRALRDHMAEKADVEKTSAPIVGAEVKAPGALRASAASAWKIGENPPKPKTIPPNAKMGAQAGGRATAKPPSKTSFYKDLLSTMANPQRGSRLAKPE